MRQGSTVWHNAATSFGSLSHPQYMSRKDYGYDYHVQALSPAVESSIGSVLQKLHLVRWLLQLHTQLSLGSGRFNTVLSRELNEVRTVLSRPAGHLVITAQRSTGQHTQHKLIPGLATSFARVASCTHT